MTSGTHGFTWGLNEVTEFLLWVSDTPSLLYNTQGHSYEILPGRNMTSLWATTCPKEPEVWKRTSRSMKTYFSRVPCGFHTRVHLYTRLLIPPATTKIWTTGYYTTEKFLVIPRHGIAREIWLTYPGWMVDLYWLAQRQYRIRSHQEYRTNQRYITHHWISRPVYQNHRKERIAKLKATPDLRLQLGNIPHSPGRSQIYYSIPAHFRSHALPPTFIATYLPRNNGWSWLGFSLYPCRNGSRYRSQLTTASQLVLVSWIRHA